ncbi:MAG TPA: SusC/RagA family TonB-linked outer membrane protein [Porphyromonadaceae bacterium]|nr:SusC/RagA family TonB-linked outer membrane protein [Porphyromonadaceae bacterium]HBX20814.1 SusC/RagA family TonB-linked outer membrane protein [Porphyromonadaceae bacterium]
MKLLNNSCMKKISVFVFLFVFGLSSSIFAQKQTDPGEKRVTLSLKNQSVVEVFKAVQVSTGLNFIYNDKDFSDVKELNVEAKNEKVKDLLKRLFSQKQITFEFTDNTVVVRSANIVSITGIVRDKNTKEVLPGANVLIVGTSKGTQTNIDGTFTLSFARMKNNKIAISFLGYATKEVDVNKDGNYVIELLEDSQSLADVVITGYANINKSSFTGSSTKVSKDEILKISPRNVIDVLQVFDPSFRIIQNNQMGSDPNTLPEFYIRGRTSIDGVKELDQLTAAESGTLSKFALTNNPNLPIFILDGYEVSVQKIYDMDPNRINSVTILKDAAATAIYGSRASNGVIVVESVTPKIGDLMVSYTFTGSLTAPDLSDYNLMNASEKLEAEVLAGVYDWGNANSYDSYAKKVNLIARGVDTDWMFQPLQNAINQTHGVSIGGGTEGFRFGVDLGFDNQNGVMKDSYRKRFRSGLYVDYRVGKIQFRNQVSYDYTNSQESPNGSFSDYASKLPYERIYDDEGALRKTLETSSQANPLYEASLGSFDRTKYNSITNNFSFDWYLSKQFHFRSQFSITQNSSKRSDFTDPLSTIYNSSSTPFQKGDLTISDINNNTWNLNAYLMYNNFIKRHHINMSAGVNAQEAQAASLYSHYRGFPSATQHTIGYAKEVVAKPMGSDNKTRLGGVFLSGNYTYDNIYLVDASIRIDGSSEFGSESKYAPFWVGGLGLNFHNYEFLKENEIISQLKIRGTYGLTGKVNYPPYVARHTYNIIMNEWYTTGMGATLNYLGNEKLKWERTYNTNIGFDITLYKKFTLNGSYYNRQTLDMIADVAIPSSSGFTVYKGNMGEIRNRGWELTANYMALNTKDIGLNLFGSMAHNQSKLMKLAESLKEYNEKIDEFYNSRSPNDNSKKYSVPYMKYEEGSSLTAIYGMKSMGINPMDGKEVFLNRAGELTSEWESSQQVMIGDTEPKVQGAFGLNFRWKQFSVFTSFLYQLGGQEYNQTLVNNVENADIEGSNVDKRVLTERWRKPGDVTALKNIAEQKKVTLSTSRFVQDLNQLKFNSLSLSYDVNPKLIKYLHLSMMRLQISTSDLAVWSTVRQERGLSYPYARTFNFSLNLNF